MAKKLTAEQKEEIIEEMLCKAMYDLEQAILDKFPDADFDANIDGAKYNKQLYKIAEMYISAV
jgi:hypothetical protein